MSQQLQISSSTLSIHYLVAVEIMQEVGLN